jgi:hypothetical protein
VAGARPCHLRLVHADSLGATPPPGVVVLPPSPLPALVAIRGELHPTARRRVDEQHWQWVLRRLPISLLDVEISGRYQAPGLSLAGGADVQGAQGVGA